MIKTFQFRIKDSSRKTKLKILSSRVNFVWNYLNRTSAFAWKRDRKWLSEFDLNNLISGTSKELGLASDTIQSIVKEFVVRRNKRKKPSLRKRYYKDNLGWIPVKIGALKVAGDTIIFMKKKFRFWNSRDIIGKIKTATFSQDAKRNWYINLHCEVEDNKKVLENNYIGIDLGLKTLATFSDGNKIENPRILEKYEEKLAKAQRAKKTKQVKSIHTKIKNVRNDFLHKVTTKIASMYNVIFVGDVSSSKLTQTKFAKSVNDVSWNKFKLLLEYKVITQGGSFEVISENFSTIICSKCGLKTGPSGLDNLGVRNWECNCCRATHDRDVNAAKNILNFGLGHETLIKGIPVLYGGEDVNSDYQ